MYYNLINLDYLIATEFIHCFQYLQLEITHLDLFGNKLGKWLSVELIIAFNAIKIPLTQLSLGNTYLNHLSINTLERLCVTLPRTLTVLDLRFNNLFKYGANLARIVNKLPILASLDLGGNFFYRLSTDDFIALFQAIHPGLTSLGLSANNLGNSNLERLQTIFSALPSGLLSVDLSDNSLDKIDTKELALAIHAMPKTITHIDFSNNQIYDNRLMQLIDNLPENIKTIGIDTIKVIDLDMLRAKDVVSQVKDRILQRKDINELINTITPSSSIKESNLDFYISILGQLNSSIACITSALLLAGQISHKKEEQDQSQMEKRIHDSISYYNIAVAKNASKKSTARFLLWNLKNNSKFFSVTERLAQYDLYVPQMNCSKKDTLRYTNIPVPNETRLFRLGRITPVDEPNSSNELKAIV